MNDLWPFIENLDAARREAGLASIVMIVHQRNLAYVLDGFPPKDRHSQIT
jgi:hypothetical protein